MNIDGETLQIRSGSEVSNTPWKLEGEKYYAELEGISVFYYTEEYCISVYVDENTTGKERWFTVSGTKNGKEISYKFRQKK